MQNSTILTNDGFSTFSVAVSIFSFCPLLYLFPYSTPTFQSLVLFPFSLICGGQWVLSPEKVYNLKCQ